ncbi:MAG: helical backbone metal receptor [Victivallaceae bacterium]|jgi:iron complex transport system substrate-binding protein|nr:helical backbone metal receptor [Victivallaceae bacterium]MDD3703052.1 helical backbone metal receptor [Victivallaceae bacterium]MDD4317966.1 helical backbone metal receptor [Victivallaceae bacterium]MDD5663868.1 helical backbone metal receptor [Victivallaceae bacterium]NLK83180.1 ABC transporter substrate-binding protein [Lentisphaerota bacterium]
MRFQFITILLLLVVVVNGAERVVSLTPNLTELIYKLKQEHQLSGRSSACDYPPEVKTVPVAGEFAKPSLEPLAALRPTLVVSESTRSLKHAEAVRNLGIKFVSFPSETIEDYLSNIATMGKLLNCPHAAAKLITETQTKLDAFRKTAPPPDHRPKVLILISASPLITVGKRSYIHEMIELAGGRNIAAGVEQNYFTCSMEFVVEQQPDIMIITPMTGGMNRIENDPAWQTIPAIKNKRVHAEIDPSMIYRLGPRTIEGITIMRKIFYPVPKN